MDAHLRDLRYFVAVAEELSFTRAAEKLYISQPALSKQVRVLEQALGARLFRREHGGVELTAAGAALLAAARPLLRRWDDAVEEVSAVAAESARLLRLGIITSLGRALYPTIIDHFIARLPGWRVELRSFGWADSTAGLRDRSSDVAFVWLPIEATGLIVEVLVREPRYIAMSADHPLSRQSSVTFDAIADEPLAALPRAAGAVRDFWLANDARNGGTARIAAEVTSADEVFEIVATGAAMAFLAEGNARIYARPGVTFRPVLGLAPAELAIAHRAEDHRPVVRAFVQACREAVADPGRSGTRA
ncbi:LysR family transcriptional regulator [Nocardia brasiliensis]|uniref:LysR family transcriptional regulator n=1 Tax=Nocardia brasiliensis TaxID=37326 RepID=UPI003D9084CA